jgi:hypothetical protein
VSHSSHIAAPSVVQAVPVAASPFSHVHELAAHASPALLYPASHSSHIAAPSVVQAAPVAASPFSHVHELATHDREHRSWLEVHPLSWSCAQPVPDVQ